VRTYERLVQLFPHVEEYRIYHSQSLLRTGSLIEAEQAALKVSASHLIQRVLLLQLHINLEDNKLANCWTIMNDCLQDNLETMIAHATLNFKEGNYQDSLEKYLKAFHVHGFEPGLAYNLALCHYKEQKYEDALVIIAEIISRGLEMYPEFAPVSPRDKTSDNATVVNSQSLQDTFVIEAYNLKAAIEFRQGELTSAKDTMGTMPHREEEQLDPVSLHNNGLIYMDSDATDGFKKFKFLLSNPPFPPETFGNILLLYCKNGYNELAADILAENLNLTYDMLTQELYEYLDAAIMVTNNPDEALKKFDSLSKKYMNSSRKLMKIFEAAKREEDKDEIISAGKNLADELEMYIPILMTQASIHWNREDFSVVEKLFHQSADLCQENRAWKLNVAHALYMQQGSKFKDCIRYYEPFVKGKVSESIFEVAPIILANLCVAYIMTNQNEEAEDIMKLIEREEDRRLHANRHQHIYHGCIVNLVIGTLYCEKGNFEFGIKRICKSLEPYESKLSLDTWFYTKRCFLALADKMAKQMIFLKDSTFHEIILFLDNVSTHGANISSSLGDDGLNGMRTQSISFESRQVKHIFLQLMD